MTEIEKFQAGWNPDRNAGSIVVYYAATTRRLDFDNPAEFNAILQVLTTPGPSFVDQYWTIWATDQDVKNE